MRDLRTVVDGLWRVRDAGEQFLLRGAVEELVAGPMLLDGLLRAIEQTPGGGLFEQQGIGQTAARLLADHDE